MHLSPQEWIARQEQTALFGAIRYFRTVVQLADALGVPRSTAQSMVTRKRLSKRAAHLLNELDPQRFKMEEMRPTAKDWVAATKAAK
jgi:hypothetical protein